MLAFVVVCLSPSIAVPVSGQEQVKLPDGASVEFFLWSEGARLWQRAGGGAAAELARGILFDCAVHSTARRMFFPPERAYLAGSRTCRASRRAECAAEADKAFAKAVEQDASLLEARLRWNWAKIERGGSDTDLQAVFDWPDAPSDVRYLAAMFKGRAAWSVGDEAEAQVWFRRATGINTSWLSARLALSTSSGNRGETQSLLGDSIPSDARSDPWYGYRCTILTPGVRSALAEWMRRAQGSSR